MYPTTRVPASVRFQSPPPLTSPSCPVSRAATRKAEYEEAKAALKAEYEEAKAVLEAELEKEEAKRAKAEKEED